MEPTCEGKGKTKRELQPDLGRLQPTWEPATLRTDRASFALSCCLTVMQLFVLQHLIGAPGGGRTRISKGFRDPRPAIGPRKHYCVPLLNVVWVMRSIKLFYADLAGSVAGPGAAGLGAGGTKCRSGCGLAGTIPAAPSSSMMPSRARCMSSTFPPSNIITVLPDGVRRTNTGPAPSQKVLLQCRAS